MAQAQEHSNDLTIDQEPLQDIEQRCHMVYFILLKDQFGSSARQRQGDPA